MKSILGLLLILASSSAVDRINEDGRLLHTPDCGYACVFAESVRDQDQDVTVEERSHSAQPKAGGSGEEGIAITQLPAEPK
jgi:hypothetical protein